MKKTALIFPGQGSQYIGMGKDLYECYEAARDIFDKANAILEYDLKNFIFAGDETELKKTENAQVAIFVTSMAAYHVFREVCEIEPAVVAGHSLGEITALTAAGVFRFEDALKLVRDRALFMKNASVNKEGKMFAIRNIHQSVVEDRCGKLNTPGAAVISNYNSLSQVVISGDKDKVSLLAEQLKDDGASVTELKVSGAFHSPLMEDAKIKMKKRLEGIEIHPMLVPVISNVTGELYRQRDIIDNLTQQITQPVQWLKTIEVFVEMGINSTVEIGPGRVLSNLTAENAPALDTYLFGKCIEIDKVIDEFNIKYKSYRPNIVQKCISIAVCTKNYNYDPDDYKNGVIDPVNELKNIDEKVNEKGLSQEDIKRSVSLLERILETKRVPEEDKQFRLLELRKWSGSGFTL